MEIELRFYRERYNTDSDYYMGDEDIYAVFYFQTIYDLEQHWNDLIYGNGHWFEGETYSAWCGDMILCGGAFDPDDFAYIKEEYMNMEGAQNANDK